MLRTSGLLNIQAQDTIVGSRSLLSWPRVRKHAIAPTLGITRMSSLVRRAVMSPRKVCCFTLLATIAAFAPARSLNRYTTQFDVARPSAVPVQSRDAQDLGTGKLLVASRNLDDPSFAKTVILLIHCDDQGVVGLILNRRTDLPLSLVLKELQGAENRTDPAFLGGPVEVPDVFALFQSPSKVQGAERIFHDVYLISTKPLFEQALAARPNAQVFHVYLGYAGWSLGQLRKEVELGAWFIFPADADAVFNSDPGSLWQQMIRKTELKYAGSGLASPRSRTGPVWGTVPVQARSD